MICQIFLVKVVSSFHPLKLILGVQLMETPHKKLPLRLLMLIAHMEFGLRAIETVVIIYFTF